MSDVYSSAATETEARSCLHLLRLRLCVFHAISMMPLWPRRTAGQNVPQGELKPWHHLAITSNGMPTGWTVWLW
jgi:hypothetical protein